MEFLAQQNMSCVETQSGLVNLIEALADYREEGEPLFPEIFVVDDLGAFLKPLPGSQAMVLGQGARSPKTMALALKRLAPLARDGWNLFIERTVNGFSFGLLQNRPTVLSLGPGQVLFSDGPALTPAISVRSIGPHLVQLRGTSYRTVLVNFGTRDEQVGSPANAIEQLVRVLANGYEERAQEQAMNLYRGVFNGALQTGHGTLAAVIHPRRKTLPQGLRDCTVLDPALDLKEALKTLIGSRSADAEGRMRGLLSLFSGMLRSDGVTLLTSDGKIAAYNCFVKHTDERAPNGLVIGGARRRAFEVLKSLVARRDLMAAYMQSQDGGTEFSGVSDV